MHLTTPFLLLFIFASSTYAQVYKTSTQKPAIKSLYINKTGEKFFSNIIQLNSNEVLQIKFDEMSHATRSYSYTVIHCNANWTKSNLQTNEYIEGFTSNQIHQHQQSSNTTHLYTNYKFEIPNNDMRFKISGNYVVLIYEDNNPENAVAQVCFSIYEPRIGIDTKIRSNTDIELNGRLQQLDIVLLTNGIRLMQPADEIEILVRQNNRYDNQVFGIKPNYIKSNELHFVSNKHLIFEGGNEFRSFDISSVYAASKGIENIKFQNSQYVVDLTTDKIQKGFAYSHEFDADGQFIINYQESNFDNDTEADYMLVNFTLSKQEPFFDGMIYVGGGFNYELYNSQSLMHYNFTKNRYEYSALLKQGGYNYQYRKLAKGSKKATTEAIGGSFWQTSNEYSVFVYYRPLGGRFDRLIGYKQINSMDNAH